MVPTTRSVRVGVVVQLDRDLVAEPGLQAVKRGAFDHHLAAAGRIRAAQRGERIDGQPIEVGYRDDFDLLRGAIRAQHATRNGRAALRRGNQGQPRDAVCQVLLETARCGRRQRP